MKKRVMVGVLLGMGLAAAFLALPKMRAAGGPGIASPLPSAQEQYPVQKPTYDYMSTLLSRNTKPLGLKENPSLRDLLRQPNIKWAVRASIKHSLE